MLDPVGDRMKALERTSDVLTLSPETPVYARLDGRSFSSFTRSMERPFDARMTRAMADTAEYVARETNAAAAFVQSDEISLVWRWRSEANPDGQALFGGRQQKLVSVLSSLCSARFVTLLASEEYGLRDYLAKVPHFDARVVQMPDEETAAEMFAWRGADARRNAVNQIGRSRFSHRDMNGVPTARVRRMLDEIGEPVSGFPPQNLYGTLMARRTVEKEMDPDVLSRIPAHKRPEGPVVRSEWARLSFPLDKADNLRGVLFGGEDPGFGQDRAPDGP